MRRAIFILILIFFTSVFAFSQRLPQSYIIGEWQGWKRIEITSKPYKYGKFNFLDNTRMILTDSNGTQEVCTYVLDTTKYPVWLDIVKPNRTGSVVLKGIIVIKNSSGFAYHVRNENGEIVKSKSLVTFINDARLSKGL